MISAEADSNIRQHLEAVWDELEDLRLVGERLELQSAEDIELKLIEILDVVGEWTVE